MTGDGQVTYASSPVPPPPAGRDANKLDWGNEVRPAADLPVPEDNLLIRMANSQTTSAGPVVPDQILPLPADEVPGAPALEEQRNGEWRYLEFLQVTSWITADIFMREIPGETRARHPSRLVGLPERRY